MARTHSENKIRGERTYPDHNRHIGRLAAPTPSPLVKTLESPTTQRAERDFLVIVMTNLWEDGKDYRHGDLLWTTEARARQLAEFPGSPCSRLVLIPEPQITRSRNRKEIRQMPTLNDPKPKSNGDSVIEIIPEKRSPRFRIREVGGVLRVSYHCPCGSLTTSSDSIERCAGCGRRP